MRRELTKEQAKMLLKSAQGETLIAKRDFAILNILLRCGLRSIEIERADVGDVRSQNGTHVLYVHGKGRDSKDEFVVLTKNALASLEAYISLRGNVKLTDPLFGSHGNRTDKKKSGRFQTRSIRRMVKKHLKALGLNSLKLTCHSLRHTFATLAYDNNATLLSIKRALRHSSIGYTTDYIHEKDQVETAAENHIELD